MFLLGLGLVFVGVYARQRLWHTDLWDHANYGKHILSNGIPDTEPLLQLAKGTPFVATAWLSQVIMALLLTTPWLGLPALQFAHGLLIAIAMAAVGMSACRNGRSVAFGIMAYGIFVAVNWQQLMIFRPQLAGVSCFSVLAAALLNRTTSKRQSTRSRRQLILIPAMFVLWANCHGSFAMGLMLIGLTTAGRCLDVYARTTAFQLAVGSQQVQHLLLLMLLCLTAASINPFGVKIFPEVLRVGSHPNIKTMFEWDPMTLRMKQGQVMALSVAVTCLLLWLTPRRISFTEHLSLIVTGGLAVWSSRMINWFAPIVAISIGIHGHAVFRQIQRRWLSSTVAKTALPQPRRPHWRWTLINCILVLVFIIWTPLGKQTLKINKPTVRNAVSFQTPVELAKYLTTQDNLADELTFVPAEWAGYIMHAAPKRIQPFVNLHVHVIPEDIWADYVRIVVDPAAVETTLAKYHINTVVTDKFRQGKLIRQLTRNPEFQRLYEDQQAIVFRRSHPME